MQTGLGRPRPAFTLADVHRLADARSGDITLAVSDHCAHLGIFNEDVWLVLEILDAADFYDTIAPQTSGSHAADVYCVSIGDRDIYLKFSIVAHDEAEMLIVLSVREDEQV